MELEIQPNLLLPKNATKIFIPGPVGSLECLVLKPAFEQVQGIAIIFHPDPKGGGSNTNKVVQTLAKALNDKGYICYCPNLRSVGESEGLHDNGVGEVEDAMAVHRYTSALHPSLSLALGGFSFGTAIASSLTKLIEYKWLILIGPAVTRYPIQIDDPAKTVVIHGQNDEIIPVSDVFNWGEQNQQPIIWVPDTTHFFHGKLIVLQNILKNFLF